jgi:hypothetical protein
MATNPYSYGSLGQRWTVGEPTSKSLLDVSRVKADANRWALEQLIVDPDDTANFVLTAPGLNIDSNTLYVDGVNNSVGFRLTNPNDYAFNGTPSWVASGGAGNASVILVSGTTSIGYFAFADGTTGTDRYSGNIQYNHSTNTMSFNTNGGVEAMSIDSSQRVGIGTTSPAAALSVQYNPATTNGFELIDSRDTNDRVGFLASGGGLGIYTSINGSYSSSNLAITVDTSQRVGLGTASPAYPLEVAAGTGTTGLMVGGSAGQVELQGDGQVYGYQKLDVTSAGLQIKGFSDGGGTKTEQARLWLTQAATGARGGEVRFYTDNGSAMSERARITKDGDARFFAASGDGMYWDHSASSLGIGTASPQNTLHVKSAADNAYLEVESSAVNSNPGIRLTNDVQGWQWQLRGAESDSLVAWDVTGGVGRLYLTTDGNLGVGTASPVALSNQTSLTINGTSVGRVDVKAGGGGGGVMFGTSSALTVQANSGVAVNLDSASGQPITFQVGSSEKARIDSNGAFLVNKTSATGIPGNLTSGTIEVQQITSQNAFITTGMASGNVAFGTSSSASHNYYAGYFYQYNGSTYTGVGNIAVGTTSTSYNTSSDYRLKENVVGITDGITRIKSLKPSRFNFIADADRTVDGFVAHEVSDVVPEAISGTKDAVDAEGNPEYQGIDQSKLVPLLTAALQEAITKIETLETKVAALEAA